MFSQFISPAKHVKPKTAVPQQDEEEYILSLAPFTCLPKICFDNVLLGSVCRKTVIVRNPTSNDIKIFITKLPSEQLLELNWYKEVIRHGEDVFLEMQWKPVIEGSWRDVITFQDGGRLRKDVSINFKCIKIKKTKPKAKPKPAVVSTKVRSPFGRKNSPLKKLSPTKVHRKPLPDITNHPTITISLPSDFSHTKTAPSNRSYVKEDNNKENVFQQNSACVGNVTFGMSESQIKSPNKNSSSGAFEDSLESPRKCNLNVSEGFEEKIKRLGLTPNMNLCKEAFRGEISIRESFSKNDYLNIYARETGSKWNISSSTQIRDSTIELTSPKSTIASCNLSPITNCPRNNETFEIKDCRVKNNLELIIEETSSERTTSNNKIMSTNTATTKLKSMSPRSKFTKTKPLNLKAFFEECNVKAEGLKNISTKEVSVKLHDSEKIIRVQNPLLLNVTSDIDPFLSASIYYNLQWVDEQETRFKKWLNALLTPPIELNCDTNIQIDVGKLWNDCKKREVNKAPTREIISNKYHVKNRLDSLRKAAFNFITSKEINNVLSKISGIVDNNKLQIRNDRDVHLDLSIQAEILQLFISYNPLWLRIGLETIYGVTIPLHSNSDIMGLSLFIAENYFKDSYLLKKHKSALSQKYSCDIKKLVLKRFLSLIYFLDQAKLKQLIPHNPCLFSKKAPYKESREILLKFSRDLLFAVGDVTKFLRHYEYILSHKQTYIHEFDYAVSDLGTDLRDGVRLTRIMEIILLKENLTENLRVPAISRLQKIHNTKIAFDVLAKADYEILHDIQPKDIVDGHKEKTLSFLWQIIYKFEAPRLKKAVITIQSWWRSLFVVIKRNIIRRFRNRQIESATKIQRWYRKIRLSRMYESLIPIIKELMVKRQMENSAIKIQSFCKMIVVRKNYLKLRNTMISLQSYSRRRLVLENVKEKRVAIVKIQSTYRMHIRRTYYLKLKRAVISVEERYLSKKLMLKVRSAYQLLKSTVSFLKEKYIANRKMQIQRENYLKLKQAALVIQRRYCAKKLMVHTRREFMTLKYAATTIQRHYRANKKMQKVRSDYLKQISYTVFIQRKFRANQLMKKQREEYLKLKKSCILIQQRFRGYLLMRKTRAEYLNLINTTKKSVRIISERYLAKKHMMLARNEYLKLRESTVCVQRLFRANQQMKQQREYYKDLKEKTVLIQCWFRSVISMRAERRNFENVLKATRFIQSKYRAKLAMKKQLNEFIQLKKYTILIQAKVRAIKQRRDYLNLKRKSIVIQRWFKSTLLMKREKTNYEKILRATKFIQCKYKAKLAMKRQFNEYVQLRKYTIFVQTKFRANKARGEYLDLKQKTIVIQRWLRSIILMKVERKTYENVLKAAKFVQTCYKAKLAMKKQLNHFLQLKMYTVFVQRRFRANQSMKRHRKEYLELKESCTLIQQRFRGYMLMKACRVEYLCLLDNVKASVQIISNKYLARKHMILARNKYQKLRETTIWVQRILRANRQMRQQQNHYKTLKQKTIIIQGWYRSIMLMKVERENYKNILKVTRFIQNKYKAKLAMKKQSNAFLQLKKYAVFIQAKFRANKQRKAYLNLRKNAIVVQRWYRAVMLMKITRYNYQNKLKSIAFIQAKYKAQLVMRRQFNEYNLMRKSALVIQRKYKAHKLMIKEKSAYLNLKEKTIIIQRWYRSVLKMRKERDYYLKLKQTVVFIQNKYRFQMIRKQFKRAVRTVESRYIAQKQMKAQRKQFMELKYHVGVITTKFKAKQLMEKQKNNYQKLRNATILIQRKYRATIIRKRREIRDAFFTNLQAHMRGFLVRKTFKKEFTPEKVAEKRRSLVENKAALKIQAFWRGYRIRHQQAKRMCKIRENLKVANHRWHENETLEQNMTKAIAVCLQSDCVSIHELHKALKDLDFQSRVSRRLCIELSMRMPEFLYDTITFTTRSEPEKEIIALSISVLINFWRVPEARDKSWIPDRVDMIITKMSYWCDKNNSVFVHFCTLMWMFSHSNKYKRIIKAVPHCQQRLKKIKTLCERKQKMMSRTATCTTISYFGPYKGLPIPSLEPDWGINYQNKPKCFKNSMQGIENLLNILEIS